MSVELLGGFGVARDGHSVEIPTSTWRLVAYLALASRPIDRITAASGLWLESPVERAQANLRTCLWRLNQAANGLINSARTHLSLADSVAVDVRSLYALSHHLPDAAAPLDPLRISPSHFCAELLPDWDDDFVKLEREQLRQVQLHSLEALGRRLLSVGRPDLALQTALTAVTAAPLRESAHRLVISIHLDEGNVAEALRHYDRLTMLLLDELGIGPSPAVRRLVAPYSGARSRTASDPSLSGAQVFA